MHTVLMLNLGSGSVQVMISGRVDGSVDEGLIGENTSPQHCPSVIMFLFLGKARGMSLPNRVEICPEWEKMEFPVHALHFSGVRNE